MSENINDMDQLLDEKISNMKFEFKDAYWTEMEALLDQQKRKKGLLWWVFGSAMLTTLVLLLFWMYFIPTNKLTNQYASETIMYQQKENNETLKSNVTTINHDLNNQKKDEVKKEEQIKTNISVHSTNTTKLNQNQTASNKVAKLNYSNSATIATNTNQKVEKINLSQNNLQTNNTSNSSSLISADENQIQSNEIARIPKDEVLMKQNERDLNKSNQIAHSKPNELIVAPVIDQMSVLPFSNLNKSLIIPSNSIEIIKRNPLTSHSFFAEAGVGYGSNSFSKPNYGGEKVHLGFVYQLEKANWGLKTGLNASWTSVNGLNYSSRQKIYGFSSSIVTNQLNYRSLINMVIPLEATYHIKKHMIGLGVQLNVLLTSTAKAKDWSEDQLNTKLQWNYRESLKPVSLAAVFDYTYNIAKRWNIGASFSYSITPVLSNEQRVFNDQISRMFSGQLFIQYKLNNFKK